MMDYLFFLLLLWTLNGDGLYTQTFADFPMLEEKNDCRIDIAPAILGMRASVSYGMADNWFVQAHGAYLNDISTRVYGQLSSGWYRNYAHHAVWEWQGGASFGYGKEQFHDAEERLLGHFGTLFLQSDYGWRGLANSHIDVALGAKCGYSFSWATMTYDYGMGNTVGPYPTHALYFEPTLMARFGWEHWKIGFKASYNFHTMLYMPDVAYWGTGKSSDPSIEVSLNYHFGTHR